MLKKLKIVFEFIANAIIETFLIILEVTGSVSIGILNILDSVLDSFLD